MWIPGFSLWRVRVDDMHTLDLGVYQIVCACALVELVEERVWPCATHEEGITKAYREYKAWCKSVGTTPCHKFKWKNLERPRWARAPPTPSQGCPDALVGTMASRGYIDEREGRREARRIAEDPVFMLELF